eukprot:2554746-Rhodomonas_salina.1
MQVIRNLVGAAYLPTRSAMSYFSFRRGTGVGQGRGAERGSSGWYSTSAIGLGARQAISGTDGGWAGTRRDRGSHSRHALAPRQHGRAGARDRLLVPRDLAFVPCDPF